LRCDQRTICVASHQLAAVRELADRIVCLRSGRLCELAEATQPAADRPPEGQCAA
jgi:ABC-type multidrug transport system ATPase subunit